MMTEAQKSIVAAENVPPIGELDPAFEDRCIDLLAQQESMLSEIEKSSPGYPTVESLDSAKRMLINFLEFAETHFDKNEYSCAIDKIVKVYERTKELETKVQGQSWAGLKRFFGAKVANQDAVNEEYRQLGEDYAALYANFFSLCISRLRADQATKDEYLSGVMAMVSELLEKW